MAGSRLSDTHSVSISLYINQSVTEGIPIRSIGSIELGFAQDCALIWPFARHWTYCLVRSLAIILPSLPFCCFFNGTGPIACVQ